MAKISTTIDAVLDDLNDPNQENWEDAELLRYVNRFYELLTKRLVLEKSDLLLQKETITLAAGSDTSNFPTNYWASERFWVDGETKALDVVDYVEILMYTEKFGSTQGTPLVYALYDGKFHFRPVSAGDTIYHLYWIMPTALTQGSDIPYNEMFDESCKQFMVWRAQKRSEYSVGDELMLFEELMGWDMSAHRRRAPVLRQSRCYRWDY